ncbi:aspartic proteinase nepenthesin-2 [Phtheirospermum japonicum]|uniref:Aspartic proteinase nepenthesin-2 n=1 Tax=Phtheirospermum japonicum TaxID=374723 RepID=A0A830C8X7_9LAMI|nr:aspartic proteinase nepenthesin-2 [Phtheirospermum japonicum]
MDTGSSLVWFPCTQNYACSSCNFQGVDPTNITTFLPELSSSTKLVACKNPKCRWFFPNFNCTDSERKSINRDSKICPSYELHYGSGSTTGFLLTETLIFPGNLKSVDDFVVGCSVFATGAPTGVAGFGRGLESLPSQMGLKRFSYCMVSHQFDDALVYSDLVLDSGAAAASTAAGGGRINYTPFRKITKTLNPGYKKYYYVTLRKDSAGNGGTMVDSGTTFTFMENPVFEMVAREFEKQVGNNYSRATEVENKSGLRRCYRALNEVENSLILPQLSFHFKGGAKLALPLGNYFSFWEDSVVCMTVNTDNGGGRVGPGPAIILGNYQQQDIYMEYDLENERLGFRKQFCR